MTQHHSIDRAGVKELWDAGEPCKIIGWKFGVRPGYISGVARANGWKPRKRFYSEQRIQQVLELYLGSGMSAREVGKSVKPKLSKNQVLWIVRRYRHTRTGQGSTHI